MTRPSLPVSLAADNRSPIYVRITYCMREALHVCDTPLVVGCMFPSRDLQENRAAAADTAHRGTITRAKSRQRVS